MSRKKTSCSQQIESLSELPTISGQLTSSQPLSSFNYVQSVENLNHESHENVNDNSLYDDCFNTSFSQPAIPTFSSHFDEVNIYIFFVFFIIYILFQLKKIINYIIFALSLLPERLVKKLVLNFQ